jgi:hypothetical protein
MLGYDALTLGHSMLNGEDVIHRYDPERVTACFDHYTGGISLPLF